MLPVSIVTMVSPACFVSSMSRLPKPHLETDARTSSHPSGPSVSTGRSRNARRPRYRLTPTVGFSAATRANIGRARNQLAVKWLI